jgi:hypothetical protein
MRTQLGVAAPTTPSGLSQPLSAACTYQDWITRLSTEFGFNAWCEHLTAEFGTEFRLINTGGNCMDLYASARAGDTSTGQDQPAKCPTARFGDPEGLSDRFGRAVATWWVPHPFSVPAWRGNRTRRRWRSGLQSGLGRAGVVRRGRCRTFSSRSTAPSVHCAVDEIPAR